MSGLAIFAGLFAYMIIRSLVFQGGLALIAPLWRSRVVDHRPVSWRQLRSELVANLLTYFNASVIFAVAIAYRLTENTATSIWPTFLLSFVWWEVWFYASHRAFHSRHLFFIHRQHHTAQVNSPLSTMSFSALESTILLIGGYGPILLWQFWVPVSFTGVALYSIVNFLLGLYLHSNTEFLPKSVAHNSVFNSVFSTPTFHSLHHARGSEHFGLFTPVLDRWLGSTHADYEHVYDQVVSGTAYPIHKRSNLGRKSEQSAVVVLPVGYEKCS